MVERTVSCRCSLRINVLNKFYILRPSRNVSLVVTAGGFRNKPKKNIDLCFLQHLFNNWVRNNWRDKNLVKGQLLHRDHLSAPVYTYSCHSIRYPLQVADQADPRVVQRVVGTCTVRAGPVQARARKHKRWRVVCCHSSPRNCGIMEFLAHWVDVK